MKAFTILGVFVLLCSTSVHGQEQSGTPFSHKGFKATLGLLGFENDFDTFGGR